MLKVLLTTNAELTQDEIQYLKQLIAEAGATPVAVFAGHPPLEAELFECNPDVIVAGGSPIGLVWALLLRLKSFRLQGKKWPKVIVFAEPVRGRYIGQIDQYKESELDYFYDFPPYRDLYDIALEHITDGDSMAASFRVLEVEHLTRVTGVAKQWKLTDGFHDYGRLSFKFLEPAHLSPPVIVCDFQGAESFIKLRPLFDSILALWPHRRDKPMEWEKACSAIRRLQLHLIPLGESIEIDKILVDPNKFSISIEGGEAGTAVAYVFLA